MWQEVPQSSRRSRLPTLSSPRKERARSYSPHQCQIRRLYRAIEAIETPHLDAMRSRGPRSPAAERGTLGGLSPIIVLDEKQVQVSVHEGKEVDGPVSTKAAKLLGCYDDVAQRSSARRNRSGRIPLSKTEVRLSNWHLDQNLSVTRPDTPVIREYFELEGDFRQLRLDTRTQHAAELPGSLLFSSVSWSGADTDRHELPATPTTPAEDWEDSLKHHPLRLSKSSSCVLSKAQSSHDLRAGGNDEWAERDTRTDLKPRNSSRSSRYLESRPITVAQSMPLAAPASQIRNQGLRKVKARDDLRMPPRNIDETKAVPIITVTNPTLDKSRQRARRAEKKRDAGFPASSVMEDFDREEQRWEEITEAADLELYMAVLAKEIEKRKMAMRS